MKQREIKFRVWNKDTKKWVTNLTMRVDNLSDDCKEWHELSQFTGLMDKNGKEIYEGDILILVGGTCDFLVCGLYAYQRIELGKIVCVQKLLSGFTLCVPHLIETDTPNMVGKVDNYTFWNNAKSLKIIGNLYENPELLTTK